MFNKQPEYCQIGTAFEDKISKTTFIVTSYVNQAAEKTSSQLIIQLLESQVKNKEYETEKSA